MNAVISGCETHEDQRDELRRKRVRVYDPLVDEALEQWANYLRVFFMPRASAADLTLGTFFEDRDSPFFPKTRCGVSNPTLASVLADEDQLWAWPKSVHALIGELPLNHRKALFGSAMGKTQMQIAVELELSQQHVSKLIAICRRSLGIALVIRIHTLNAARAVEQRKFR